MSSGGLDRRAFLKSIGLGITGLVWGCQEYNKTASDSKPNVLFIFFDDLNDWVLHPPGYPKAKIPNMDRLREKSVNFSNAHATVPVCAPSRKCLFSGLYPQTIDDYGFAPWGDVEGLKNCVPMPLHFRNNGYNVYGTGKLLHYGAGNGEGDFYTDYGLVHGDPFPDYGPWPWKGEGKAEFTAHPAQYKMWKDCLAEEIHRDLNYGPLSNVPEWEPDPDNDIPGAKGWYYASGKPFLYVSDECRDKLPDEISADYAVNTLNKKHDRPFFLGVGFVRPHTPLYVPKKYFDMFPVDDIQLPPYLENDLDDCAAPLRDRWLWGRFKFYALGKAGGQRAWKEWVQAYLACMAFVDDQVGKILDALESSAYRDNTIVILSSDNGYHVGEKDCIQKWHLWERSTRVPLFIHVPNSRANGKTCDHPVGLIDLYPTLVDLCGIPKEPNKQLSTIPLDGYSLRPFLNDPAHREWNGPSVAFTAIRDIEVFKKYHPAFTHEPHFSVRSKRYRYTLCATGEEELYDHKNDPHEWMNLANNPKYDEIKDNLRKELITIRDRNRSSYKKEF